MTDNITAIIIVLIIRITGVCFAGVGVYAMLNGFYKTGAALAVGAILGSFFTRIKIDDKPNLQEIDEAEELAHE